MVLDGGRELIEFRLKALTARGEHIVDSLRQSQHKLNCDYRSDELCLIEITEMPDQRIDPIVTMPRPAVDLGEWKPYTVVKGMYGRRFDKGTTAERIHESLNAILRSGSGVGSLLPQPIDKGVKDFKSFPPVDERQYERQ